MSAAIKHCGITTCIALDRIKPKSSKHSVTKLDLTLYENQLLVLEWLTHPLLLGVFIAPPCGTASLARNIELPGDDPGPKPLRSEIWPDGLPGLQHHDLARVSAANILYHFTATVFDRCTELGIPCVVENPKNSLFWRTTMWTERVFSHLQVEQLHQACAYGSRRPKWTLLVANFDSISFVCKTCPMNHEHEPWGPSIQNGRKVYATALEVHYPPALCQAIAQAFLLHWQANGISLVPLPSFSNALAQAASGKQPATGKLAPYISEFKSKFFTLWTEDACLWPASFQSSTSMKRLYEQDMGNLSCEEAFQLCKSVCNSWNLDVLLLQEDFKRLGGQMQRLVIWGQFWEPEEFVEAAMKLEHPYSVENALPKCLLNSIRDNVEWDNVELARHRVERIAAWSRLARDLSADEDRLKSSMDPSVADVVKKKRLLLFKQMLVETEFPDIEVMDELIVGASLVGEVPQTNMLPKKFVPAVCSLDTLAEKSSLMRKSNLHSSLSSGDAEIDSIVWEKTLEEVEKQWLEGPLDPATVPNVTPLTKRFGLKQKLGKTRLIDDYSESNINDCVTVSESPMLHTVDVACSLLACWFDMCERRSKDPTLVTRTFDLASAYRQVPLNQEGRKYSVIRVHKPGCKVNQLFRSRVLPFGSIRSVHSFLRLSRALWWVGTVGLKLMWTSFYDDFICMSCPQLARCAEQAVCALFHLTGWLFAEDGPKCLPFNSCCDALGVKIDLAPSDKGRALICNTASRIEELVTDIRDILKAGFLSAKSAQKLRGRMQFAESQLFGRTGKRCIRILSAFAEGSRCKLEHHDIKFLECFVRLLQDSPPREISSFSKHTILIFTDACYEKDSEHWPCGVGGVLIDVVTRKRRHFSVPLDADMRATLGENRKKQLIFEAESLAALVAVLLWRKHFEGKRSTLFVDNEGSKYSLIKGHSSNSEVDFILSLFVECEACIHMYMWIARVASKCNIADAPSRGESLICDENNLDDSTNARNIVKAVLRQMKEKVRERGIRRFESPKEK